MLQILIFKTLQVQHDIINIIIVEGNVDSAYRYLWSYTPTIKWGTESRAPNEFRIKHSIHP